MHDSFKYIFVAAVIFFTFVMAVLLSSMVSRRHESYHNLPRELS